MPQQKSLSLDAVLEAFLELSTLRPRINMTYAPSHNLLYLFNGAYHEPVPDPHRLVFNELLKLKSEAKAIPSHQSVGTHLTNEVIAGLKRYLPLLDTNQPSPYIAFEEDGLVLNTDTWQLSPATPSIPVTFGVKASSKVFSMLDDLEPPARFLAFLNQIFEQDQERILFIQQMMGYFLLDSTAAQAAFFFYGGGQNGKSVLLEIIAALIPDAFLTRHKLDALTTNRFRIADLISSRVNIAGEEESKYFRSDTFKDLVSGEPVSAERKFEGSFSFKPRTKFLFATNSIPTFDGISKAIQRRLFIVPFNYKVPDNEKDPLLAETIIKNELPLVLAFALAGARDLQARRFRFNDSSLIQAAAADYRKKQSSSIEFFEENYQITEDRADAVSRSAIFTLYKYWCDEENRKPVSRNRFFEEIENAYQDTFLENPKSPFRPTSDAPSMRGLRAVKPTDDETAFIHARTSGLPTA